MASAATSAISPTMLIDERTRLLTQALTRRSEANGSSTLNQGNRESRILMHFFSQVQNKL